LIAIGESWRIITRTAGWCLAVAVLTSNVQLFGHHALTEFDDAQVKTIEGTLIDLHLKNPHSVLTIQTSGPAADHWAVEWLAVLVLKRQGVDDTTLKPGDHLIVTGHPSRNRDDHRLWLRTIARPADHWSWSGSF
jgi:hypothetical protein